MIPNLIVQRLLYEIPTIGISRDISVTDAAGSTEFFEPGLWLVQNMGPNIAFLKMFDAAGKNATVSDMPLFPYGSMDMSHVFVQIGMMDRKQKPSGLGHPPDLKFLSAICATGETATLRATRLTKD